MFFRKFMKVYQDFFKSFLRNSLRDSLEPTPALSSGIYAVVIASETKVLKLFFRKFSRIGFSSSDLLQKFLLETL